MSDEAPSTGLFSSRKSLWVLGIGFAILVLVHGYALWEQAEPFDDRPFDAETWRMFAGSEVPDNPRGRMAEAVVSEVLEPGMTREAVVEMLGPAEFEDPTGPLTYNLGMWSGPRTEYDWLDIYFDTDGRFTHAEIVQH